MILSMIINGAICGIMIEIDAYIDNEIYTGLLSTFFILN